MVVLFLGEMANVENCPRRKNIQETLELFQQDRGILASGGHVRARALSPPARHRLRSGEASPLSDRVFYGARLAISSPCLSTAVPTLDRCRRRDPERISDNVSCPRV